MRRLFLAILLILAMAGECWGAAATYYTKVDPTNGATKICYSTTSHAAACTDNSNKTFANLLTAMSAGDIVDLSGGESGAQYTQQLNITKSSTWRASTAAGHTGLVTLGPPASADYTIKIQSQNGVTITGPITVIGHATEDVVVGILLTCTNIVLDGLRIQTYYQTATSAGIYMSITGAGSTGNEVKNCTILNYSWASTITGKGIHVSSSPGWSIHNNVIGSSAYRFANGIYVNNSNDLAIYANTITYCWDGIDYPDGANTFGLNIVGTSANNLIYRNTVNYAYKGINAAGDGGGNKYYYNYIYMAAVNSIDHIGSNEAAAADEIYNNTIIHHPTAAAGHGIAVQIQPGNVKIKNNIIDCYTENASPNIQCISISGAASTVDIDNNIYFLSGGVANTCRVGALLSTPYFTLEDWQTVIASDARFTPGKDVNSISTDPLFIPGTHIPAFGSPAINAGVSVAGVHDVVGCTDYEGNTPCQRGSAPDIGAYEWHKGWGTLVR